MTCHDTLKLLLLLLCSALLLACGAHGYHQVRKGETLYSISFTYGHDYRDVAKWNDIKRPYIIRQGQVLRVVAMSSDNKPQPTQRRHDRRQPVSNIVATAKPASKNPQPTQVTVKKTVTQKPEIQKSNALKAKAQKPQHQKSATKAPEKIQWQWPAQGQVVTTFLASQPARKGLNISGKHGAPVRAAASGRVVYSGNGLPRYGNLVIIKHSELYLSAYAHNDSLLVAEGDSVVAGKVIAKMGATGADKVMLHFEIRKKGKPVNPAAYLPQR